MRLTPPKEKKNILSSKLIKKNEDVSYASMYFFLIYTLNVYI